MSKPEIIDGQDAKLYLGGELVGGAEEYRAFQGSPATIPHRPIKSKSTHYLPPVPDYGIINITLYRNHADAGQQKMAQSQAESIAMDAVFELADGTRLGFKTFCESLPLFGGKKPGQTLNKSTARLRITGQVRPAS